MPEAAVEEAEPWAALIGDLPYLAAWEAGMVAFWAAVEEVGTPVQEGSCETVLAVPVKSVEARWVFRAAGGETGAPP